MKNIGILGLLTGLKCETLRKFEIYKINNKKNDQNSISFNFISKVSVKFSNMRFWVIRS